MDAAAPGRRATYGIDAPALVPIPILLALVNIVLGIVSHSIWPFIGAGAWIGVIALSLYASKRGKFIVWEWLLDGLALRGDESILDIGCGRGAVFVAAARRVPSGRAVGVDLWRKSDQSGNAAQATMSNADAESVADRVTLFTADARSLPFADGSFDVVLSSLALHNIKRRVQRDRAIDEAVRILKPGGRLLIADIWGTRDYVRRLSELGMVDVTRRGLGWRVWWGGPWVATRLVQGTRRENV